MKVISGKARVGEPLRRLLANLPEGTMNVLLTEAGLVPAEGEQKGRRPGSILGYAIQARFFLGFVKTARSLIFGSPKAPFKDTEEAEEWIQSELCKADPLDIPGLFFGWFERGDSPLSLRIPRSAVNLAWVRLSADLMSDLFCVPSSEAARIILTGEAENHLNIADLQRFLSDKQESARRFWDALSRPDGRLTRAERMLLDAVNLTGLPPEGKGRGRNVGRAEYWSRLAETHRKLYGSGNPEALRRRWERLIRRIGAPEVEKILGAGSEGSGSGG